MLAEVTGPNCRWLCTGREFFSEMLAAIAAARQSVCLETFIFAADSVGERFRDELMAARGRGVRVQVLIDALGSYGLPAGFWKDFERAGGEVRWFNPLSFNRLGIRDHRKLLVCDQRVGFVGGFNIGASYEGDGVSCGWCDLGVKLQGPLVGQLAAAFQEMYARSDFQHKAFIRLRRNRGANREVRAPEEELLLSGPGRGRSPIKRALFRDLQSARSVRMMVAYFLPPWRLRRQLVRLARQGAQVELLLAGKSDVQVSLLAARSLYRRLLKGRVRIFEYQPQILHAKLFIIDDAVYVGSSNLDQRSLNINYELMVRLKTAEAAAQAREIFSGALTHCREVTQEHWRKSCSLWQRLKQRWAYLVLVRLDPYIAQRQWRAIPD